MMSSFRGLAVLAGLLFAAESAWPQTVSTWSGGGGNGNWTNAGNWDVLPASGANTELVFTGSLQPATIQNLGAPIQLTALTLADTAGANFSIGGGPLQFVAGTNPASITTNSGQYRLLITAPIELTAPTAITMAAGNPNGGALFLNGPITGSAPLEVNTLSNGELTFFGFPNNTGYSGTVTVTTATIAMLGAPNALGRNTAVALTGSLSAMIVGTIPPAGYGAVDRGFHQQIGGISGTGQFSTGTTNSASTAVVGFNNQNTTLSGPASLNGFNGGSHFGKVGTGTLTVNSYNGSVQMALSIRDGTLQLSGANGGLVNNPGNGQLPADHTIYSATQLRVNNAIQFVTPPPAPGSAFGRLSDVVGIRLAGGTFRIDGNAAVAVTEILGAMKPYAGQSSILLNPTAAQYLKFDFSSFSIVELTRGGQTAFAGGNLGAGTGAGQSGVTFLSAPSLINGIFPWAMGQTNYVSAPGAAANTVEPDTLATYGVNGVQPLTSFIANNFTSSTANVLLNAAIAPVGPALANSLTIDPGGSLTLSAGLTLTAGAIFSRAAGASIDGLGAVSTSGRLYLNTSQQLTMNAAVNAAHLSKGAGGVAILNGSVSLGANPLIAVNAGTLAFGVAATVTPSSGTVIYQVSRNAQIDSLRGSITGTLRGNGTVAGSVTIAGGGTISPSALAGGLADGASPGTLTLTGPLTLLGGARWQTQLSSKFGGNYTQSLIDGQSLDLSAATSASPIIIQPRTLLLTNDGFGPLYDAVDASPFAIILGTFPGGIVGYSADKFTVDTSQFSTAFGGPYVFSVEQDGTNLVLQFGVIPEPALLLVVAGFALIRKRRK